MIVILDIGGKFGGVFMINNFPLFNRFKRKKPELEFDSELIESFK